MAISQDSNTTPSLCAAADLTPWLCELNAQLDGALADLAHTMQSVQSGSYARGHCGSKQTARVKMYGDIVAEYEFHPESKCADAFGNPCDRQTTGLLGRRHIKIDQIKCIGKESNSLENVDTGLVHSDKNAYTEYIDHRHDEWTTKIRPALKKHPLRVFVRECRGRLSRRALIDLRAGRSRPHRKNQELLVAIIRELNLS